MAYIPEWIKGVREKYKTSVANAFILTGNIGDYCSEGTDLKKYLCDFITKKEEYEMRMDKVYFYDIEAEGRRVFPPSIDSKDDMDICWKKFMEKIIDTESGRNAFVFFYPQFLIPEDSKVFEEEQKRIVSLDRILNSSEFINSNNTVFIIAETAKDINSMFTGSNSKTAICDIPLPDSCARKSFVDYYIELWLNNNEECTEFQKHWEISVDELVNLTAGLQLVGIEDILLSAFMKEKHRLQGRTAKDTVCLTRQSVMKRKKEVIQKEYGDVIEVLDTAGYNLEKFAGQEELKSYIKEVVIRSFSDPETAAYAPKGIIMMGPPGTGKTYFARCMAGDAGINFIEFKMSKILGKYVGESEKSMERALSVFRALAPVGVFIDEIDQAFPSRTSGSSESSVNANLFGMILSEMSKPENRGRILWLGATNYPNHIDEALKRPGRFDKKIPFFAPDKAERKQVFLHHLKKAGVCVTDDSFLNEIVESTDGYTQAEIEAIVVKANELSKRKKVPIDSQEILMQAKKYMISTQNQNIKDMEDLALMECNDAEFIPEQLAGRHRKLLSLDTENKEATISNNRIYNSR